MQVTAAACRGVFVAWWETLQQYWQEITAWGAVLNFVISALTIGWILTVKKDSTSAVAWCLLVLLLPLLGALLFLLLGYQHVNRPLIRKRRQRRRFRQSHP